MPIRANANLRFRLYIYKHKSIFCLLLKFSIEYPHPSVHDVPVLNKMSSYPMYLTMTILKYFIVLNNIMLKQTTNMKTKDAQHEHTPQCMIKQNLSRQKKNAGSTEIFIKQAN